MTNTNSSNGEKKLQSVLDRIEGLKVEQAKEASRRSDQLTKPPGSLGRLEDIAKRVAGITGELWPDLSKRAVVVMAGDHGV